MIPRYVTVAAGVWLMFSPAVFSYGDPAAVSDRIAGPIGGSLAFVAIWEIARGLRWGTVPVGLWLIAAPLVLTYDDVAAWVSSIAVGLIFVVSARFGGETEGEFGGGWRSLREPEPGLGQPSPVDG